MKCVLTALLAVPELPGDWRWRAVFLQADLGVLAALCNTLTGNMVLADGVRKDADRDLTVVWGSPSARGFRGPGK